MPIADPRTAPRRDDLPFLRHRSRPAVADPPPASSALADFVHGASPHPKAAPTPPAAPVDDLLDLSSPAPAAPTDDLLDLSSPAPAAQADDLLDLSSPAPAASALPIADTPTPSAYQPPRVQAGPATVLSPKDPTVTLTRLQSGVGVLTFEAACSPAVGDLRLGCAYQLRSGTSSVVQYLSSVTTGPPHSSRPVLIAEHAHFERLILDLVQVNELQRMIVYAFSESGGELHWGGTLVTTTFGQARVELPLDRPPSALVTVLMSAYNIDGELVLRAEMESLPGSVRDVVSAYGFDRISWLDARTPLV